MIREFAFGLGRRHYFEDASNMVKWMNLKSDTYMSLYEYDNDVKDYFAQNKKLSGYDGKIYIPEEFILDVDGGTPEDAQQKAIGLKIMLDDLDVPLRYSSVVQAFIFISVVHPSHTVHIRTYMRR